METVILRLENEGRYGTAHVYQSTLNADFAVLANQAKRYYKIG